MPELVRFSATASAVLGVLAIAAAMASLWPGLQVPAWPAGTAALPAVGLACLPGRVALKAIGTLTSTAALAVVVAEVGALWALSSAVP